MLFASAAVFTGMYFTARELHSRGTFVDDTLYANEIKQAAARHNVDPQLVRAVVFQESRFKHDAVGRKGEAGLMQVMPKNAAADWARLNGRKTPSHAELMQVELNLEIGVWYLAKALNKWQKYKDQIPLALIQYNAGERRAERWKPETFDGDAVSRIKIPSTSAYVKNTMRRYRKYLQNK